MPDDMQLRVRDVYADVENKIFCLVGGDPEQLAEASAAAAELTVSLGRPVTQHELIMFGYLADMHVMFHRTSQVYADFAANRIDKDTVSERLKDINADLDMNGVEDNLAAFFHGSLTHDLGDVT